MEPAADNSRGRIVCEEQRTRPAVVLESLDIDTEFSDLPEGVRKHLYANIPCVFELAVEQGVATVQEGLEATDQVGLSLGIEGHPPMHHTFEVTPACSKLCPEFVELLDSGGIHASKRILVVHRALAEDKAFKGTCIILDALFAAVEKAQPVHEQGALRVLAETPNRARLLVGFLDTLIVGGKSTRRDTVADEEDWQPARWEASPKPAAHQPSALAQSGNQGYVQWIVRNERRQVLRLNSARAHQARRRVATNSRGALKFARLAAERCAARKTVP
jgi:hypothetical protein